MTAPSPSVRAVARVAPGAPAPSGPAEVPRPRRRPSHLGRVHLLQLLLVETAVVGTLAAATQGTVPAVATGVAGAAVVAVTLARRSGRWWLERWMMSVTQRRRRRNRPVPHGDPRVTALRHLAPGLTAQNVSVGDSSDIGVARDDAGWYACAAVSTGRRRKGDDRTLPLDQLVATLADTGQPGAVLQVVSLTVPAPGMDTPPASHAGQSYRQLLTGFGAVAVPAHRSIWITVRLDAQALAEAVVDEHGTALDDVPDLVAALLHRVTKTLRRAGYSAQPLDVDGLLDALTHSCDLETPTVPGTGGGEPREEWSRWHSRRLAHRTFWVRRWPASDQIGALLDAVATTPSAMSSVALILAPEPDGNGVDLRGLVRLAAPAPELNPVCLAANRAAELAGADLFPLDGEHNPAVYASAPTGGGAR
ncbi:type VII secretion protein EccE [Polymorphospora rubra]|uniref:Type VII secretion protein EccE n=1 Tax=Polymorphospora rubra TaxID=338584 RepID=A0A810N5T3_9ACTN|nr:type VII secretion protein EccE [Polymorphospora rubra]BCJ68657.1 type VII secretion protein EccE [Polymorphospora rubra]